MGFIVIRDGRILLGNRDLERLCGRRLRTLYAMPAEGFLDLIHSDDRERVRLRHKARVAGYPIEGPYLARILHRTGSVRWVAIHGASFRQGGSVVVQALLIDMTGEVAYSARLRHIVEDQQARGEELETRVRERAAQLEDMAVYMTTVFESSYDGIGIVDGEGRFERGNPASFRILGWPAEELIGEFFLKVFPPDWHAFMIDRWAEVQRGDGGPYETQAWSKDGERRDLRISHRHMTIGGKRKYAVVVTDITPLKRAQVLLQDRGEQLELRVAERTAELTASNARLRRSEEALARAQAIAHIGSFEWCPVHGHLDWSAEMRRLHGLDPAQPLPKDQEKLRRTIHPDDIPRVQPAINHTLSTGDPLEITYRLLGENGAVRHVFARGERRPCDQDPSAMMLVGTLQDITEQRKLEQEVIQASRREQERIGADIHDSLGQELSALSMLASTLHAGVADGCPDLAPRAEQVAAVARTAVRHARVLAHGLAPIDIKIGGLQTELRRMARDAASLHRADVRFVSDSGDIVRDVERATHLYHIAKEAVSNALRHGRPTRVDIRLAVTGERGSLRVSDNGTWSRNEAGAGAGLRIMRLRADLLGASLSIKADGGKGTRVICDFPNDAPGTPPQAGHRTPRKRCRSAAAPAAGNRVQRSTGKGERR